MIVDDTYFVGQLTIAQLSQAWVAEDFDTQRTILERNYLTAILGQQLAADFLAGIDVEPMEAKWSNLLNGVDGIWGGFKNDLKTSPIANYIYYHYNLNLYSNSTGSGEVIPQNENSQRIFNYSKLCKVWNEMVDMNFKLQNYLNKSISTYPMASYCQPINELFAYKNSLNI